MRPTCCKRHNFVYEWCKRYFLLMCCLRRMVFVAASEPDIHLHDFGTVSTFFRMCEMSSTRRDLKLTARKFALIVPFQETFFKNTPLLNLRLPFIKFLKDCKNCSPISTENQSCPFAQNNPSFIIPVGKQLLDFFCLCFQFSNLLRIVRVKVLYFLPENASIILAFTVLSHTEQLYGNLSTANDA